MRLETIATFDRPGPARLAAMRLEAAGIPSTVADDCMAGLRRFYSTDGAVRVRVAESDAAAARRVLSGDAPDGRDPTDGPEHPGAPEDADGFEAPDDPDDA
jgi:hypothetical protein